jgi:hypothetical protein
MWLALSLAACQGDIRAPKGGLVRGAERPAGANAPANEADAADLGTNANTGGDTCNGIVDVAASPLRRLTRAEYEHSVADVFGVTDATGAGLAVDERIDGIFASNLSSAVAPVQVRQYLDAAESISARANVIALVPCDRAKNGDEACARQFVERLGRRTYRRPLQTDEIDRYLTQYRSVAKLDMGHTPALRAVVQSLLQSPYFLYHLELIETSSAAQPSTVIKLERYALASRLAFFLWSSTPDDALLDAAGNGELDTTNGVAKQARRMLEDARASQGIESFHAQWLGLPRLDQASRDAKLFPEWNAELVAALRSESAKFSDYVIRDRRGDLRTLLSAAYSFPSGPGLAIREVADPLSDRPVELDASRSLGLLTQPAFLAAHSHTNQTSPILRGRALRERFFCQPLPDPPPNVAAVAPELSGDLTTRERYAMHRTASSACFSCHHLIDDLGFALEHYDPVGRYRERENGKPIDATGQLTDSDVDGSLDGATSLAARMSNSEQVQACYATQWFRYALGRSEREADRCSLQRVHASFTGAAAIADLLVAIATSDAFMQQRVEE